MRHPGALAAMRLRARRGASSIEFAVGALVVLVLVIGVFEAGNLYLQQRALDAATVATARWASVNSGNDTASALQAQFQSAIAPALGAVGATCTVTVGSALPSGAGCSVAIGFLTSAVGGSQTSQATVGGAVTVASRLPWTEMTSLLRLPPATLVTSASMTIMH